MAVIGSGIKKSILSRPPKEVGFSQGRRWEEWQGSNLRPPVLEYARYRCSTSGRVPFRLLSQAFFPISTPPLSAVVLCRLGEYGSLWDRLWDTDGGPLHAVFVAVLSTTLARKAAGESVNCGLGARQPIDVASWLESLD
jgi:hypothetical protein